MARLMASLHRGDEPLTMLAATSGDTGSAVAHAFHGVPHTRVVILYPDGRVSPTQEAQLTMFNGERGNVRAYAVAGSFDDCHRLTREAFADPDLRRSMRLTSANSVNIGRLLPQMVYYFHAVAQLRRRCVRRRRGRSCSATPSGNFGNLTAGLMAKRAGLPIARFVAATNVNDVVPAYLETGRFEPRAVGADARERDGRRPPEQLRAHAVAVRRRSRRHAPRRHRLPVHATTTCARRSGGCTRSAATCSIRTARSRYMGLIGQDGQERQAGQVGRLSGDGASGEVRRDRRADHRPAGREAGAAGRGAQRSAAHHPDPRRRSTACLAACCDG